MNVGENIKRARLKAGLTQKQLGELSGMADSAIRRYENNRANPKLQTLEKIATALGLSTYDLFDDSTRKLIELAEKHGGKLVEVVSRDPITEKKREILNAHYDKLNHIGHDEAVKRVEELTHIEKYTKEDPD